MDLFSNKRFRYIMIGLLIFFIVACTAFLAATPGFIWLGHKKENCSQPLIIMMWVDNSTQSCKELGTICAYSEALCQKYDMESY